MNPFETGRGPCFDETSMEVEEFVDDKNHQSAICAYTDFLNAMSGNDGNLEKIYKRHVGVGSRMKWMIVSAFLGVALLFFEIGRSSQPHFEKLENPDGSATTATNAEGDAAVESSSEQYFPGAPTFLLAMGLEGTGHRFLSILMRDSPMGESLSKSTKLELKQVRWIWEEGLMHPGCSHKSDFSPNRAYEKLVQEFRVVKNQTSHLTTPAHIPFNTMGPQQGGSRLSYPDKLNCDRTNHPQIDIFYQACAEAQINGGILYMHRDPYATIRSTTINRNYNGFESHPANGVGDHRRPIGQAIFINTLFLNVMYSQMMRHPSKTKGCIRLYDTSTEQDRDQEHWDPLGEILGIEDRECLTAYVANKTKAAHKMTGVEKNKLIPADLKR